MSPRAYGHTGFTGTSIAVDPDTGLFVVLLTNRVCPTRENGKLIRMRSLIHNAAAAAAGAKWVVVEQDQPSLGKTSLECAALSIAYVNSLQ